MGSTIKQPRQEVNQHLTGKGKKVQVNMGPAGNGRRGNSAAGALIFSKGNGKQGDKRD